MIKRLKLKVLREDHDKINTVETRRAEMREELKHVPVRVQHMSAKGIEYD